MEFNIDGLVGPEKRLYQWMLRRLIRKSKIHGSSMIWAWYRYGSDGCCPDLNDEWLLPQGMKGVCLEIEVPDEMVLLSQFEMWNWVLNDKFVPVGWSEEALIERVSVFQKYRSWNGIFDLSYGDSDYWGDRGSRSIQAVFPYLDLSWVRECVHFVSR